MKRTQGFTLIEIAIVLVIIGLLLGGVLKGQELITGARVRNLISQQDGIKAAFFGFQDRYRGLPGDYSAADTNINCPNGCPKGDGNGRIEATSGQREDIFAWTHLTSAGFINGSYTADSGVSSQSTSNTPSNPYSQLIQLVYDGCYGNYGDCAAAATGGAPQKHNLKTGSQVPSEILAEVDRKIDDGKPTSGAFQFSPWVANATSGGPDNRKCLLTTGTGTSAVSIWSITSPETNCGATSLF
jgi:prepilin-type N-terminal cleavage/methylation domain-containing protein